MTGGNGVRERVPHNQFIAARDRRAQTPAAMKNSPAATADPREARALARFAVVQTVIQARQSGLPFAQACQHAAQQVWDGRHFSARTVEEWYYRYHAGQFAALQSHARSDKGSQKALDPAAVAALLELRRAHPNLTLQALSAELVRRGVLTAGHFSLSSLYRRLAEAGLDRGSLRAGVTGAPTKAFELPLPNLLWMADAMHGPTLKPADAPAIRTFLFALIDDCSRLCVHGQFYAAEGVVQFLDTLRQAVQTRGVPDKLYTDNGAACKCHHLGIVCANLGVRLLHCQPYHSWSKGKIERFFQTVQSQFLPTLTFEPVGTLDQLNRRFWRWLETEYHQRAHGALGGESPARRFARLGTHLRLLDPATDLTRLFLMRVERRVRKDATFSLGGFLWEVPAHLRGQVITVRFDPIGYRHVEAWLGERSLGAARRCDKHRNAQLRSSNDYASGTPR